MKRDKESLKSCSACRGTRLTYATVIKWIKYHLPSRPQEPKGPEGGREGKIGAISWTFIRVSPCIGALMPDAMAVVPVPLLCPFCSLEIETHCRLPLRDQSSKLGRPKGIR